MLLHIFSEFSEKNWSYFKKNKQYKMLELKKWEKIFKNEFTTGRIYDRAVVFISEGKTFWE